MKEKIHKECHRRVSIVLNSELNATNRINSLTIILTTYSFGISKWSFTGMHDMDGRIRKILAWYLMYHSKSDVDRIYLSRKISGRGLIHLEQSLTSVRP